MLKICRHLLLLVAVFVSTPAMAQSPVTIEYWNINSESFGGPQVAALIEAFQNEFPHITVESRPQNGYVGLVQNLQATLAAGNPPDVIQIGYPYSNYVANNLPYVSIADLIAKFGGEEHLDQFPDNVIDLANVNGEQIGLAYSLSNALIYYNADMFLEAGLNPDAPPTTFAEWREAATAIRQATGKAALAFGYNEDNWTIEIFAASNGGDLLRCNTEGFFEAAFDSPEASEALQTWADLIADGLALNASYSEGTQAFLVGETAAYMSSIAARQGLQTSAPFELRGAYFPRFGEKLTRLPGGGNILVVFSRDEAKQEAAWEFMRFLTSPEGFTEWTKGTGYVPLIPGLTDDPDYLASFVAENPIQQVGVDQLQNVFRWTSFPGADGLAAGQVLFQAVQRALSGQASAEAALGDAARQVNSIIRGERCN